MIDFRTYFPIYKSHPRLCYLDNAATGQKLAVALEAEQNYYTNTASNVHRGMYPLAEQATLAYENARTQVAKFINAETEEIVFTSGTTEGINQLVSMLSALPHLTSPRILLGTAEHHSNILPWQRWESARIEFADLNNDFHYNLEKFIHQPDIIALSLVSNVTGAILDVKKLRELYPESLIILDAAQAVAHIPIDVKDLGVDAIVFSGHKLYAGTGIGVIWAKKDLWQQLSPAKVGGGIVREVYRSYSSWEDAPGRFEAGTPPIAQAIGLGAAVDFLQNTIGWKKIQSHEQEIIAYLENWFATRPDIELYRPKTNATGIFSFSVEKMHAHDIAFGLGQSGVAARAGHHCTQILHREVLKTSATTRFSIGLNNTDEDLEKLTQVLPQVLSALQ